MIFLTNKYTKWYWNIITNAKARVYNQFDYAEIHHVIPRSLGGLNTKENLVKLTAKEHFVCHRLLTKMTEGTANRSMHFAMWSISRLRHKHLQPLNINSRTFSKIRKKYAEQQSLNKIGVPRSAETKRKISESKIGQQLSEEAIKSITKGIKQRYHDRPVSLETRIKIGNLHRGKTLSDETKNKIGAASKGRTAGGEKEWTLKDPFGNIYKIVMLSKFCKERGLPWKSISNTEGTNTSVTKGIAKGWIVIQSSRLCVNYGLKESLVNPPETRSTFSCSRTINP